VQEEKQSMLTRHLLERIRLKAWLAADEAKHTGREFTPIFWRRINGRLTYIARLQGQKRSVQEGDGT
jgi:hypothetical protein